MLTNMLNRHRWSQRGVVGHVSWVERVQPYVDGWATVLQNVITEDRPPTTT
jgi:hypothetical protein